MSRSAPSRFADTVHWVALVVKQDQYHTRAVAWARRPCRQIVTTEAVLIETAARLARPDVRAAGLELFESIRTKPSRYQVVPFSDDILARGWRLYADRRDKAWSLTDCLSFVVMADLGLTDALTADDHFRQAGFVPLLQSDPPEAAA